MHLHEGIGICLTLIAQEAASADKEVAWGSLKGEKKNHMNLLLLPLRNCDVYIASFMLSVLILSFNYWLTSQSSILRKQINCFNKEGHKCQFNHLNYLSFKTLQIKIYCCIIRWSWK